MDPQSLSHPDKLADTQNLPDYRQIAIDRVGITNLRFPLQIKDRGQSLQSTVANCALTVDLPHHFKGTHMSRFVEVLNAHGPILHVENIHEILLKLVSRLDSKVAHVEFAFPYFIEKKAPVTAAAGLMDYEVKFNATYENDAVDFVDRQS